MQSIQIKNYLDGALDYLDKATKFYESIKDDKSLPPVFQKTGSWVSLVQEILRCAQKQLTEDDAKADDTVLVQNLRTSKEIAETFKSVLDCVASGEEASRKERYQKTVEENRKYRVENVLKELLDAINPLVEMEKIKVTEEQRNALCDAIKVLSNMVETSPGSGGDVFNYSGTGDMFNNTRDGYQNINKGGGPQNNAKTIHIGK